MNVQCEIYISLLSKLFTVVHVLAAVGLHLQVQAAIEEQNHVLAAVGLHLQVLAAIGFLSGASIITRTNTCDYDR